MFAGEAAPNARNDEIRDNVTRMRQAWAAERQALIAKHHWEAKQFC